MDSDLTDLVRVVPNDNSQGTHVQVSGDAAFVVLLQTAFDYGVQNGDGTSIYFDKKGDKFEIYANGSGIVSTHPLVMNIPLMDRLVASMLADKLPGTLAENYRMIAATQAVEAQATATTADNAQIVAAPVIGAQPIAAPVINAQPVAAVQATHGTRETRIPRPRNSWILYRQDKSRELRSIDPTLTAGEISMIVSKMWKNETAGVRSKYAGMAAKEDAEHKQRYPGYRYNATRTATRRANLSGKKLLSAHELHTGKLGEVAIPVGCDLDTLFSRV